MWRAFGIANAVLYDDAATVEEKVEVILDCNIRASLTHQSQLPLWIQWRIWKCRNILVHQKKVIPWQQSVKLAKADALEWKIVENHHQSGQMFGANTRGLHAQQGWRIPDKEWIKCNYDVGFVSQDLNATAGWVLRDEFGTFLGAAQAKGTRVQMFLASELQGLVMAMQFCWAKGFSRVVFEGDNQNVAALVNGKKARFTNYNWLREINKWRSKFKEVKFQWVGRDANGVADILAKRILDPDRSFQSFFDAPVCINSALHLDHASASS